MTDEYIKPRANGRNIVGCYMLRPFAHIVAPIHHGSAKSLKDRSVSYLLPSSWVLRCVFFVQNFFGKLSVLGNLACA